MPLAFLGTGLLGSGFIEALLSRGESVRVWNRTPSKAEALLAKIGSATTGSRTQSMSVHDTAADAARGASRVHLCLSDDAAVDAVLDATVGSVAKGTWVIDHSTTSPEGARRRHERARREGFLFAHAPVFMSPAAAREAKGVMMLSGSAEAHQALLPLLSPMTGELVHLGARDDLAASYKLFGNAMLIAIAGGLADVFTLARSLSIAPGDALSLFSKFNPAAGIQMRGARMASGDFGASFELTMARKDIGLMLAAAGDGTLTVMPAIAARMDALIARGHGKDDLGVLALDALAAPTLDAPALAAPLQSKSSRVLGRLRHTHRRIEQRLAELEVAVASGDAQGTDDVIAFYERSIVVHEDDEERSLFPRLDRIAEAVPIVLALTAEHRAQKELWDRLIHATREAPADAHAIAGKIRTSYARHLALEERELFPLVEARLEEAEWVLMDEEMGERRRGTR